MIRRPKMSIGFTATVASALLLTLNANLSAQDMDSGALAQRLRDGVGEAVINGNEDGLNAMVTLARRAATAFPEDALLNHYLGYALYRLATLRIDTDPDGALGTFAEAESVLLHSIDIEPIPESHALMSGVLGPQIVSDETAMNLSIRATAELRQAVSMDPRNPRVRILEGIHALHTPSMFGGGADIALESFLAAAALFEEDDPAPPLPAWGHAEAYAWLGQAYAELDRPEDARDAYERGTGNRAVVCLGSQHPAPGVVPVA